MAQTDRRRGAVAATVLAVALWAMLSGVVGFGAHASPLTTLRQDALFRVVAHKPNTLEYGTAFLDPKGRVLTAYHVIENAQHIELRSFDGRDFSDVVIDYIAPTRDIAILSVPALSDSQGYDLHPDAGAGGAGEAIALHGAPLGMDRFVLRGERARAGLQSGLAWTAPDPRDGTEISIFQDPSIKVLALDITTEGGASGSPIVDGSGRVIGLLSGSRNTGAGLAWAIPMDALHDRAANWSRVQSRPADMDWPNASILVAGMSFGRARSRTTLTALSAQCRAATNSLDRAHRDFIVTQTRVLVAFQVLFDAVTKGGARPRESISDEMIIQSGRSLGTLSAFDRVWERRERFEEAWTDFHARCGPPQAWKMLRGPFPATYHNFVTLEDLTRALEPLARKAEDSVLSVEDMAAEIAPVLEVYGMDHLSTGQKLLLIGERVMALEEDIKADSKEPLPQIAFGMALADLFSAIETRLDVETRRYQKASSGFDMTLTNGWIAMDQRLHDLAFPGQPRVPS
ncbi:MAG: serine protease, partial [Pseudomonadota bacterium]